MYLMIVTRLKIAEKTLFVEAMEDTWLDMYSAAMTSKLRRGRLVLVKETSQVCGRSIALFRVFHRKPTVHFSTVTTQQWWRPVLRIVVQNFAGCYNHMVYGDSALALRGYVWRRK